MKVTNIKNIVIWALATINVFFLAFFAWGVYNDRAIKAESQQNLSALFKQSGIDMDINNIHEGSELPEFTTGRDSEQGMADAVLGQTTKVAAGGNIYNYTGEKGQAVFSSGGVFDFAINPSFYLSGDDASAAAKNLLKAMKIDTISVTATGAKGSEHVSAVSALNNHPIFNCQIDFTFSNGSLNKISGRLAADLRATSKKVDVSSSATALMAFLNKVKSGKYICNKISSVEPGYSLAASGNLSAVWRITTESGTNAGIYLVDDSGDIVPSIE